MLIVYHSSKIETLMKSPVLPLLIYLVLLFVLALIGAVIAVPWDKSDTPFLVTYLGESLGRVITVLAIPILIAVVWRALENTFKVRTNSPIIVSFGVFLMIATLSIIGYRDKPLFGSSEPLGTTDYTYQITGCDFAVDFPSEPEINLMSTTQNGIELRYEQALLATPQEFLRAECIPSKTSRDVVVQSLKNYVEWEGLQSVAYDLNNPNYVEARGYKTMAGIKSIFVLRMYIGPKSIFSTLAGSRSADYPTDGTVAFFKSIR